MNSLWLRLALVFGILFLGYQYGESKKEAATDKCTVKWQKKNKTLSDAIDKQKEINRAKIVSMQKRQRDEIAKLDSKHVQEMFDYENRIDNLLTDIDTGRVFISGSKAPGDSGKMPGNSTAASDPDEKGKCRLDAETTKNLAGIAGDGDKAIITLTNLQKYVRDVCLVKN